MNFIRVHHIVLLLLLIAVVFIGMNVESVWTKRNYEVLPEMYTSVPVDPQTARWRAVMAERSERPVPGTVSRNGMSVDRQPFIAADTVFEKALLRGRDLYGVFCSPCHGGGGLGDGPVTLRGYPPPPSLLADNARALADTAIYRIISTGQGNMAGYHSQLLPMDRWKIILALRAMQEQETGKNKMADAVDAVSGRDMEDGTGETAGGEEGSTENHAHPGEAVRTGGMSP
ncbi:MAG: cytochrome c [Bacteroidetes bacterium]|nr:cytochrome c [Bacteroidota bacterium]